MDKVKSGLFKVADVNGTVEFVRKNYGHSMRKKLI